MQDVIVELAGSMYNEGKSPDLAADFALVGLAAVILGPAEVNLTVKSSSLSSSSCLLGSL